jgi:hypothetical protein
MNELDTVVLTHDLPDTRLETGDVGTIVHCHRDDGFEVEFVSGAGETLAVLTLSTVDLRPIAGQEILHVRALS